MNGLIKNIFGSLLILFIVVWCNAQEVSYVNTDKDVYVTGESIWISIHLFDLEEEPISRYVSVELVDDENEMVYSTKVKLDETGRGTSSIFLSPSFSGGYYVIRAYSVWMMNGACENIRYKSIAVLNPLDPVDFDSDENTSARKAVRDDIELIDCSKDLKPKAMGSFTLKNNTENEISVDLSVFLDPLVELDSIGFIQNYEYSAISNPAELLFPIVKLEVDEASTGYSFFSVSKSRVDWYDFSIYDQFLYSEYVSSTNTNNLYLWNGTFTDEIKGLKSLETSLGEGCSYRFPKLIFDEKAKIMLEQQMVNAQIQNVYGQYTYPWGVDTIKNLSASRNYFAPLKSEYQLDDYKRFPSMNETLVEIVKDIYVRKDNKGMDWLYTFDELHNNLYSDPALILLDGVPITYMELQEVNPLLIESIAISNEKYYMNNHSLSGVVYVSSLSNEYFDKEELPKYVKSIMISQIERSKTFFIPTNDINQHVPDRRNTLLWLPLVKLNPGEERTFEFYTSDVIGSYSLEVTYYDKENIWQSKFDGFEVIPN